MWKASGCIIFKMIYLKSNWNIINDAGAHQCEMNPKMDGF